MQITIAITDNGEIKVNLDKDINIVVALGIIEMAKNLLLTNKQDDEKTIKPDEEE